MKFVVETKSPSNCSKTELDVFEKLAMTAGEVTPNGLRNRIEIAYMLVFGRTTIGEVAGIAALKNPQYAYRNSVFQKAYSQEEPSQWQGELGWIFVRMEYRKQGVASLLMQQLFLTGFSGKVYATAREKNDPILPLLQKFGFVQNGHRFLSEKGNYKLVLYVREA